jgi:hypothetical protein
MFRKVIFNIIKDNHGLHEDDVIAEYMIPTTFNEETEFLSDSTLNSLKCHYMTFYWKVRKDFLDDVEYSMSHESLIGSTIFTRSKKSVSCASKISSPSLLSHDTKASKVSEKDNPHDFYIVNHVSAKHKLACCCLQCCMIDACNIFLTM